MKVGLGNKMAAVTLVTVGLLATGCGSNGGTTNNSSGTTSTAELSETVNLATEQAVSAAQTVEPTLYAFLSNNNSDRSIFKGISEYLIPSAYAASCSSDGSTISNCSSSSLPAITRTYNGCNIGNSNIVLSGTTTYTYSSPGCSVIGFDKSVTRTTNLTMTGKLGGTVTITSDNAVDYRGNTIGGGQKLTANSSLGLYTLEVQGVNRTLVSPAGNEVWNLSTRTTAPISVNGSPTSGLVLSSNGGALEIIHNKAKYVLALSLGNLTFNDTCNCPVSGAMTGVYSGSLDGTSTITYTGCGTANVTTSRGESLSFSIDVCSAT